MRLLYGAGVSLESQAIVGLCKRINNRNKTEKKSVIAASLVSRMINETTLRQERNP